MELDSSRIDTGCRQPVPPIVMDGVNFGVPAKLFDSQQEAYNEMLKEFSEAISDLEAEGIEISMKDYVGQSNTLWTEVWRHFAK